MIPAVARWYQAVSDFEPAVPRDTAKVRAVTFILGQCADWWSGRLCVSTSVIAEQSGLGRNTVARILSELDRAGYLATEKGHGNGDASRRCLTIANRCAPVRLVHDSTRGKRTAVVQSKKVKEGSSEGYSPTPVNVRTRGRGQVVQLDTRRGELGALIAETRANLRTAREHGPHVRQVAESLEGE